MMRGCLILVIALFWSRYLAVEMPPKAGHRQESSGDFHAQILAQNRFDVSDSRSTFEGCSQPSSSALRSDASQSPAKESTQAIPQSTLTTSFTASTTGLNAASMTSYQLSQIGGNA